MMRVAGFIVLMLALSGCCVNFFDGKTCVRPALTAPQDVIGAR